MKVVILDGYVDEPSNLGVPPFVSPYPRYLAGAVLDAGHEYQYVTIDQVRSGLRLRGDLIVVISGPIVPGKYLRSMPMSRRELLHFPSRFEGVRILGGPVARFRDYHDDVSSVFDHVAVRDVDACVFDFLNGGEYRDRDRTNDEWHKWAVGGAEVVTAHPDFPKPLIVELDLSKGCVRYFTGGCSFCVEPLYGIPKFRAVDSVVEEVGKLASLGVVNFRLGGTADIFSYMASGIGKSPTPVPNVSKLGELLAGVRGAAPALEVLHTDNADPAMMVSHRDEAMAALKLLVEWTTPGNVLSLGMETADPGVVEKNNLNSPPELTLEAIKMVNSVGRERGYNGMPALLPGLNFVLGLDGESARTFDLNIKFLKGLQDEDLLVRRINIRQVNPVRRRFDQKQRRLYRSFREKVRSTIDGEMLRRVVPTGTVLRGLWTELREGKMTYCRQIGTYPLLVGIPYTIELDSFIDVKVTEHGQRSITAVEHPLKVNTAPLSALSAIPGIGTKRAARIVKGRPFAGPLEFKACLDNETVAEEATPYLSFKTK